MALIVGENIKSMNMSRIYYLVIVIFSLGMMSNYSYAMAKVLPKRVTVAAPEIPPLVYKQSDGTNAGWLVEKLKKAEQQSNIVFEITILPWARALKLVELGHFDAIMPALKTKERQTYLTYPSDDIIRLEDSVIIKKVDSQFNTDGKSLKSTTLAKARSMVLGDDIDGFIKDNGIEVIELTTVEDALNMLDKGRVDLVAADAFIAQSLMNKLKVQHQFEVFKTSQSASSSYLAFSMLFSSRYDVNQLMDIVNQGGKSTPFLQQSNNQ